MYTQITLAKVTAKEVDEGGAFVDFITMPEQQEETARVGLAYAGDKFGLWLPIEVGDIVVIGSPNADPNSVQTVVARLWVGADPPSQLARDKPDDISWVVKKGVAFTLTTEEADYTVKTQTSGKIELESAGDINLKLANSSGTGHLGSDDATESLPLFDTYRTAEQTLFDAIRSTLNLVAIDFATSTDPGVQAAGLKLQALSLAVPPGAFAIFKQGVSSYLSTRWKNI